MYMGKFLQQQQGTSENAPAESPQHVTSDNNVVEENKESHGPEIKHQLFVGII